jgi:bifunctional N-acetylglucosamine-1-phosphate-uridyltransferase/glucosamine-1-phosphate-acetyltransferase GlmU-like protein
MLVLAACSPQQRVARIVKKYNLPTVTEYVTDTVIMPERVRTDTVVLSGDTVVIEDTAFITEIVQLNDTTYIVTTRIQADTVVKQVPVTKYVVQDNDSSRGIGIGGFCILLWALCSVAFIVGCLIKMLR